MKICPYRTPKSRWKALVPLVKALAAHAQARGAMANLALAASDAKARSRARRSQRTRRWRDCRASSSKVNRCSWEWSNVENLKKDCKKLSGIPSPRHISIKSWVKMLSKGGNHPQKAYYWYVKLAKFYGKKVETRVNHGWDGICWDGYSQLEISEVMGDPQSSP